MKENFTIISELVINSNFDSIPKVESLIDDVCSKMKVEDNYGNILIAVTEAVNNAILHGNKNNPTNSIFIKSAESDKFFYFSIEDEGLGFDYLSLPDPTAPENLEKENGRGIFLMKNLSDNLVFENNGKKVIIYFLK